MQINDDMRKYLKPKEVEELFGFHDPFSLSLAACCSVPDSR